MDNKRLKLLSFSLLATMLTVHLLGEKFAAYGKDFSGLYFDKQSEQYFINDKASFSIKAIENAKYVDKIEVSIDDKPYEPYQGKIKFEKEGFHIVRFKAVDPVLNWSPIQSFRVYVDLSSPQSHFNWTGDTYTKEGQLYISKNTQLKIKSYDNLAGVSNTLWKLSNDASWKPFSKSMSFQKEGKYEIDFAAVDKVGNLESPKKISFVVDNSTPTASAQVQGKSHRVGNKLYVDKGSFISFDSQDKVSGVGKVEYSLNNGAIYNYTQKISVENKVTQLKYRAVDNVGNAEPWKTITVYLDANPPVLATGNNGKYRKLASKFYAKPGFKVTVASSDNESGSDSLIVDNSSPEKATKKLFSFDKEGSHSFSVRAIDKVGNLSNTVAYDIVIDDSPPLTTMDSSNKLVEKEGVLLSSLPNKLMFNSKDDGVGVLYTEVSYDQKNWTKITAPIDLATWKTPKRNVYYRSVDQLGNVEALKKLTVHVRNQGPKVDLFVESGGLPEMSLSQLKKLQEKESSKNVVEKKKATSKKSISKKKYQNSKKRRPASKKKYQKRKKRRIIKKKRK